MSILHVPGAPLCAPSHHSVSHRSETLTDLLQVICQVEVVSNAPLFQFYTHIWQHPHWFIGTQSVLPRLPPGAGAAEARSCGSYARPTALQLEGAKTLQTALTHYVLQASPSGRRDGLWADTVRAAASDICARLLATNQGAVPVVDPLQAVIQSPQLFAFLSSNAVYLLKAPRSLRKALWERKLRFASVFGHSTDTSPAVNVAHDDLASLSDARANFPGCVRWKTLMDANAGLGERGRRVLQKLRDVLFLRGQHEVNAFLRLLYEELQATDQRDRRGKRNAGTAPTGAPPIVSPNAGKQGLEISNSGVPAQVEAGRMARGNDVDLDQAATFTAPEASFLDPRTITSILANFGFQNGRLTTPRLVWNAALANGTRSIRLDCQLTPFAYARFFEGASQLATGHTLWLRGVPSDETWEAWGPLLCNTSEPLLKDLESGCPDVARWLQRHLPLQPTAVVVRASGTLFQLAESNLKKALPAPAHNTAGPGPVSPDPHSADVLKSIANRCGGGSPSLRNDECDNSSAAQGRRQAMLAARKVMMMARRQREQQGGAGPLVSSSCSSSLRSEERNDPSVVAPFKDYGTGRQCVGPAPSLMRRNQQMSTVPMRGRETTVGVLASGRNEEDEKKSDPKVIHAIDLAYRQMRSPGEGRQRQILLREVRPLFRKAIMLLDKNIVICFVGPFPFAPLTPAIQIGDLPQLKPRIMDDLVDYFVVSSSITAKTYDIIADYLSPKKLRSLFWLSIALNCQQETAEGKTTVAQLSATTMLSSIPATSPLVARVQPAFRLKCHEQTVTDSCAPAEGRTRFSRNVFFLVPDHFIADLVSPMVSDPQTRILLAAANARPLQQRLVQMRDKQRLWENAARQQLAATVEALRGREKKESKIMNNFVGNGDDTKEENNRFSTTNRGDVQALELLLSQAPNFFVHLICVLPWYRRQGEPLIAETDASFVRPNWDLKALAALRGAFEYRDSRSALLGLENEPNVRGPSQSRLLVWFVPLNYVEECYETSDITTMTEALCRHQLPGHVISTLFSAPREPLRSRIPQCLPESAANCRHYASLATDGSVSVKWKAGCLHPTSPAASTTTTASSHGGVSCPTPEHRAPDAATIGQPPSHCADSIPEMNDDCAPSLQYPRQEEVALNGEQPVTPKINDQEEAGPTTAHKEVGSVLVSSVGMTEPVALYAKPQLREISTSPIRHTSLIALKSVAPTVYEGSQNAGRRSGRKRRRFSGAPIATSAIVDNNNPLSSSSNGEEFAQTQPPVDNQNPCSEGRDASAPSASGARQGKLRPVRQHSANTLYAQDFLWY